MWASQYAFKRVGRAMLYPLFRQQRARKSSIGTELDLALRWWLEALSLQMSASRPWEPNLSRPAHLLCDARAYPPRIAAVLLIDQRIYFSDMEPPIEVMESFSIRRDGQIMGLEILSIAFGLSVFQDLISGRNIHVHSDNSGAQHTTSKGLARSFDHTCLVHCIWYV